MTQTHTITAQVDDMTFAIVERLAKIRGLSGEEFAAEAIRRVAESEEDYRAFIQVGIDAVERGDVVPQEQVVAELDTMIEHHRARCG
jgi:predicted transcriptional regulator